LAVDPADPRHIVEVQEDFLRGQCTFRMTTDGGTHWTGGDLRAPEGFPAPCTQFDFGGYAHSNGSVAWGSAQNVYTTFSSTRPNESESLLVARSSDGGRTFERASIAIAGIPGDRPIVNIRPRLAVEAASTGDKIYLDATGCDATVVQGGGACNRTAFAASTDSGRSWRSTRSIALPTEGVTSASSQPAIGPDGTVYVALRRGVVASFPRNLFLASSKDSGQTWTFEEIGTITAPSSLQLVADRRGALFLAFGTTQFSADQSTPDSDIGLLRRPAGSTTWSAPVRVNDDKLANGVVQRLPWLSVAPTGRLELLWHDRRHPYPDQSMEDYYYAASTDGGASFLPNRRVTDRSKNLSIGLNGRVTGGFYWPALVSLGGGRSLAAWADSREGNYDTDIEDIYSATISSSTSGPLPRQAIASAGSADRSVVLSRLAYPGGVEVNGGKPVSKVVIVRDGDVAGLLAGAVLARASLGPVLVSQGAGLSDAVQREIRRLQPTGAYLIGAENVVGSGVVRDLARAGVASDKVTRLAGRDRADTARAVAGALDTRSDSARSSGTPVAPAAVIVNADSPDASAAAGLAASLRLPVLLSERDSLPAATQQALASLNIPSVLVIGGPDVVSERVVAQLPAPKRLAGADAVATSAAVAVESKIRGLPGNVVYVAASTSPADGALLAAAVARLGGLLLLTPGADPVAAERQLTRLGLRAGADRLVVMAAGSRPVGAGRPPGR